MNSQDIVNVDSSQGTEEEIKVLEKSINLFTGEESLTIQVCTPHNNIPFTVPRDEFTKRKFFDKLTLHGLSIIEDDKAYEVLREELDDAEKKAPIVYYHNKVGFTEIGGKKCFCAYHPIGELTQKQLSSVNKEWQKVLEPKGSFEVWRDFVRKHFVSNPERALILMLGATAPVTYVLKEAGVFTELNLYALVNKTSRGKTTSLFMISSCYGSPRYFIDGFNATSGALCAMLQERNSYPFLCDEATYTPNLDWTELLYTLPTGKEKRRLNNKGKLRPLVEFSGAIIMTSEVSILDRSMNFGGESARIMEFSLSCFDKEPWLTEEIRQVTFNNYGWATEPLVKLLLDNKEKEKIFSYYEKCYHKMLHDFEGEIAGTTRRLIQRAAIIVTSGYILRKAIKCNFDLKAVQRYLVDHIKATIASRDNRDYADKLLDKIVGFVASNRNMFPTVESLSPKAKGRAKHYSSFWGATGFYKCKACLWIQEDILKNKVLPQEMKNPTKTMQALESKEYTVKFYGRYHYTDQAFGGIPAKYCCIIFPKADSIIKKISEVSDLNMSLQNLNAYIANEYDATEYKHLNALKEIPSLTITRAEMNSYAITVNKSFKAKMSMGRNCTLYAIPFPEQQILLLSKKKIPQNSLILHFTESGKDSVVCGEDVFNLLSLLELNLPKGYKLVSTAIEFEERTDNLTAGITFNENVICVSPEDNPPVDYVVKSVKDLPKRSNINLLLSDDEEEET